MLASFGKTGIRALVLMLTVLGCMGAMLGTANAAGITCRDIGNGLLCSNRIGNHHFDVWYDKRAGDSVDVMLGWRNMDGGITPHNEWFTLRPGQRAFHSFPGGPGANWCAYANLFSRPTSAPGATPQNFYGALDCP
ncbi:hypothetical protein ACWEV3_27340 [Saccharopolyspora sp. NPDC003752]